MTNEMHVLREGHRLTIILYFDIIIIIIIIIIID